VGSRASLDGCRKSCLHDFKPQTVQPIASFCTGYTIKAYVQWIVEGFFIPRYSGWDMRLSKHSSPSSADVKNQSNAFVVCTDMVPYINNEDITSEITASRS